MRSGLVTLLEEICDKAERFGDGRTGGTAEPEARWIWRKLTGRMTKPDLIFL